MKKKSQIIYEPSHLIEDPMILTTLCIMYDEVLLFNSRTIDEEIQLLETERPINAETRNISNKLEFIKGPLKILSSENIIKYYDPKKSIESFPKTGELDINLSVGTGEGDGKLILTSKGEINNFTKDYFENFDTSIITSLSDVSRYTAMYSVAHSYQIPLLSFGNERKYIDDNHYVDFLANSLAVKSICELGLPQLTTSNPEDIIIARESLKDELIEFKSGILDLSYFLHQATKSKDSIQDINREVNILVNTKIKSSVISLENKIKMNKNKRIRDIIISGGKILLSGGNLLTLGQSIKDITTNGLDLLDNLNNINGSDVPEHKIATYLLKTQKIFN